MASTAQAAAIVADAPPLKLRTKMAFGVGSAAETIALYSLGSYALLFYNQEVHHAATRAQIEALRHAAAAPAA